MFGTSFSSQISRPSKSYFEAQIINLAYVFGKICQLSLHSYQIIVNFHLLRGQTNALKTFVVKSFLPLSPHTGLHGQNKRRQLYSTSGKILVLLTLLSRYLPLIKILTSHVLFCCLGGTYQPKLVCAIRQLVGYLCCGPRNALTKTLNSKGLQKVLFTITAL